MIEYQAAPLSLLLNTPLSVPAYNVEGVAGSIARVLMFSPLGPRPVQVPWKGTAVAGPALFTGVAGSWDEVDVGAGWEPQADEKRINMSAIVHKSRVFLVVGFHLVFIWILSSKLIGWSRHAEC